MLTKEEFENNKLYDKRSDYFTYHVGDNIRIYEYRYEKKYTIYFNDLSSGGCFPELEDCECREFIFNDKAQWERAYQNINFSKWNGENSRDLMKDYLKYCIIE